ncbi:MAG: ribonuclease PH [Proteobacteria bacterium]|nr:ribonuclease PH [Pseudomonadota bacterium]
MRNDDRMSNQIRKLTIDPFYLTTIPHSVLISTGNTRVLCCATLDKVFPSWLKGQSKGWITAEYGMLPKSSIERIQRERKTVSGRTQEIQRLIGRSLRASIDLTKLGEKQIMIDCDVIQADGGTRTASITGGFVALNILINDMLMKGDLKENPIIENVCAISAGIVDNEAVLDLNYKEDAAAEVDMNMVMTASLKLVEVQGTGEGKTFSRKELDNILDLGEKAIPQIVKAQNEAVALWVDAAVKET